MYLDVQNCIKAGTYPKGASDKDKKAIRRFSTQFIIFADKLWKKSYTRYDLECLYGEEAKKIMREIHEGVYGQHMNGHMLVKEIIRQGYYWTTLDKDCCEYVRKGHKCQIHANLMHTPPSQLYSMTTPWLFSVWGQISLEKLFLNHQTGISTLLW